MCERAENIVACLLDHGFILGWKSCEISTVYLLRCRASLISGLKRSTLIPIRWPWRMRDFVCQGHHSLMFAVVRSGGRLLGRTYTTKLSGVYPVCFASRNEDRWLPRVRRSCEGRHERHPTQAGQSWLTLNGSWDVNDPITGPLSPTRYQKPNCVMHVMRYPLVGIIDHGTGRKQAEMQLKFTGLIWQ